MEVDGWDERFRVGAATTEISSALRLREVDATGEDDGGGGGDGDFDGGGGGDGGRRLGGAEEDLEVGS
ncbi:hypothetical protein OROHE_002574 [Orobanche hederae]